MQRLWDSPTNTTVASIVLAVLAITVSYNMFFGRKWNPHGLHCYVTGGSQGLGLALAIRLTQKGAHVSIVARDETKLKAALAQLEAARQNPEQILASYSYPLNTLESSKAAFDAACKAHGGRPAEAVFTCVGASKPMYFIDQTEKDMVDGMTNGYWVQAWTAMVATKEMVKHGVKGKICFVGSTLSYMAFVGYANYAPAKHALRGFADTLRSELILYDISVHMFFPCTMFTPGYEQENKTKPKLTLQIEENDGGITPEHGAEAIIAGVQKGNVHISGDLITTLFRVSTRGAAPNNNLIGDFFLGIVAWVGIPIWRYTLDSTVRAAKDEHREYCKQNGHIPA